MCQTLFTIPDKIWGIDVFGVGWVLGIWAIVSLVSLGWQFLRYGWGPEVRGLLPTILVSGLIVWLILPRLTEGGGLPIRSWGAVLILAIVSAVGLAAYQAQKVGLDPELIFSLAMWLILPGLVGARVFYVIEYFEERFRRPDLWQTIMAVLNVAQGGMVVYGSLLAGGLGLLFFVRKYRVPGLALADLVAPSVVLGMAIGRLGCFMNGCCYGGQTSLPWAVTFPWRSPPHQAQVEKGDLAVHGLRFDGYGNKPPVIAEVVPDSPAEAAGLRAGQLVTDVAGYPVKTVEQAQLRLLDILGEGAQVEIEVAGEPQVKSWTLHGDLPRSKPIHPTQLYSFVDALLLCLFLLAYYPYRSRDGEVAALTMTIHPISRFLIEIIRVDESAVFSTPWSISQNISIGILIGAALLWFYILRRPRHTAWPQAQLAA